MKRLATVASLPVLLLVAWNGSAQDKGDSKEEVIAVQTVRPMRKPRLQPFALPGELVPLSQTAVYASVKGQVLKIHKKAGDSVLEGDLLAELSLADLEQDCKLAEALAEQARTEVDQAKKVLATMDADTKGATAKIKEMTAAKTRAEVEVRRMELRLERLTKAGAAASAEEIAEAKLNVESARAGVAEAAARVEAAEAAHAGTLSKRDKLQADVVVAQARLKVAAIDHQRAKDLASQTKVTAPHSGVVTLANIDAGRLVLPGGGDKGEPVFVVSRTETMVARFSTVGGGRLEGLKVYVHLGGSRDTPLEATITRSKEIGTNLGLQPPIVSNFSPGMPMLTYQPQQTSVVDIELNNHSGLLRPGRQVYASFVVDGPGYLAVPLKALVNPFGAGPGMPGGGAALPGKLGGPAMGVEPPHCFLVINGKAVKTLVQFQLNNDNPVSGVHVEVMQKSSDGNNWQPFEGREEFILDPPADLKDGQRVKTKN